MVLAFAAASAWLHATLAAATIETLVPDALSTHINHGLGLVTFNVVFNRVPDFSIVDGAGRQRDGFQVYVDSAGPFVAGDFERASDGCAVPTCNFDTKTIIRGGNIHLGLGLPLIWIDPLNPGPPENGGWGPTIEYLPFTVSGRLLSFDVSLPSLRDDDGHFWYLFATSEYGSGSFPYTNETLFISDVRYTDSDFPRPPPAPIPTPPTSALIALLLVCLWLCQSLRYANARNRRGARWESLRLRLPSDAR
jgi:hypothetical protein